MGSVPITGEIVVLFAVVIGGIGGFWWRIESRLSEQDSERSKLKQELSDYKLYVAQNHVSAAVLRDTEQRLIDAIEKLAKRMEAIADRFEERSRGG